MASSTALLAVAVVVAIAAGLYVGSQTHRRLEERHTRGRRPTERIRDAATRSVFRLWKWSRKRDEQD